MFKNLIKKIIFSVTSFLAVAAYQPVANATPHDKINFVTAFVRCAAVMTESVLTTPGQKAEATANISRMANVFMGLNYEGASENEIKLKLLNLPQISFAVNSIDALWPSLLKTQPQKRTKARRAALSILGAAECALVLLASYQESKNINDPLGCLILANLLGVVHSISATDNKVKKALHAAVLAAYMYSVLDSRI